MLNHTSPISDINLAARPLWILTIAVFLAPISASLVTGDAQSINYLFVILLIVAPWTSTQYRWSASGFIYIILLIVGYLFGVVIFSGGQEGFVLRQTLSLLVLIFPVLMLFLRTNIRLREISFALVLVSTVYSIWVIVAIVTNGFSLGDIYDIKGGLREYVPDWPQRYVVILMFGLFLNVGYGGRSFLSLSVSAVILAAIFLTFTRAAHVGLLCGAIAFWASFRLGRIGVTSSSERRGRWASRTYLIGGLAFVATALSVDEIRGAFFDIAQSTVDGLVHALTGKLTGEDESENTRFEIWDRIFEAVLSHNLLFGTGSAGIYLIAPEFGSAHSQYFDTLVRTGVIGLGMYLYFYGRLLITYFFLSPSFFAGLVAMLAFGVFHETTKLSYCGFLFFLLLSTSEAANREKNMNRQRVLI